MKFIAHFKDIPAPEDDARCMAWLATTLRNTFRSNLRKAMVRNSAATDPTLESAITPDEAAAPDSLETVTAEEFEQALKCLSEKQLRVFELSQAGKSHIEIGKELGIRTGAVAKRLFDARARLKAELQRIIASRTGRRS